MQLEVTANGPQLQEVLQDISKQKTVPNVFVNGTHVGGCDTTLRANEEGRLANLLMPPTTKYDYDLVVIGGGSGGLSAAKEAADLGKKVALFDFVTPTPKGATWGLGGTCVNVGCIPKKLMHQAALLGQAIADAKEYGWEVERSEIKHSWDTLRTEVQNHIGSLNWGYRTSLRSKGVNYVNAFAEFIDEHTIKAVGRRNKETILTADKIIIATGLRPRYPECIGARAYGITSDDLFSLSYCPGKTLCVGASYVSLECAGFLHGIGFDVTVMVRSILLRGFDQDMAERVGANMEDKGITFIREAVPYKIEQIEAGEPGLYRVFAKAKDGQEIVGEYNTIIFAIGRNACTGGIGLEKIGVDINSKNQKVICDEREKSNIDHIYAIGDILDGKLELTPVAIQAGKLLARRLFRGDSMLTDYVNVATTVFTPLEYGACGFSEENAMEKFGAQNIEVYHVNFTPLEFAVAKRDQKDSYAKLICNKADKYRVVGFHVLGPNAGEITQGYAVAIRMGATKADFEGTIGIHPTCSEVFTTIRITKSSGQSPTVTGC